MNNRNKDRHVIETLGRARVVVEDGKVVEIGRPVLKYCPLWAKIRGIEEINVRVIRDNVEFRIRDFGMCTAERALELDVFVGFGASETLMTALHKGLLDATVTVCEGAGTVITSNPALVQGIGARLGGIIETSPVGAILRGISERGGVTLVPPAIDQPAGLRIALRMGYKRVGVTVCTVEDAEQCRAISEDAIIFGVHLTGITRSDAERLFQVADLVTACASRYIRELANERAILQAGTAIPIFALTPAGKELLLERAKEIEDRLLLSAMRLPMLPAEKQPIPLV